MCGIELLGAVSFFDALVAAYWIGLIVGGGLLLVSALGGGAEDAEVDFDTAVDGDLDLDAGGDFDVDAGTNVDTDFHAADAAHAGALGLSSWFSVRFVVSTLAVFGALGVVLTHLTEAGPGTTLAIAVIGGLVAGQGVHQLFRLLRRTSANSAPRPADYVNRLARVTVPIKHPDKGEVAAVVRTARRSLPAVAAGQTRDFAAGDEVVIVNYRAGVAHVVARAEFESQSGSEGGVLS